MYEYNLEAFYDTKFISINESNRAEYNSFNYEDCLACFEKYKYINCYAWDVNSKTITRIDLVFNGARLVTYV